GGVGADSRMAAVDTPLLDEHPARTAAARIRAGMAGRVMGPPEFAQNQRRFAPFLRSGQSAQGPDSVGKRAYLRPTSVQLNEASLRPWNSGMGNRPPPHFSASAHGWTHRGRTASSGTSVLPSGGGRDRSTACTSTGLLAPD